MKNSLMREIPEAVENYGEITPFNGAFTLAPTMNRQAPKVKRCLPGDTKVVESLEEVFRRIPVKDGMTLSFHHHLRNGDYVLNMVMDTAAKLGLRDLKVAASSIHLVHAPLVGHIKSGVVAELDTSYIGGETAKAVSAGVLAKPLILRTHGGRPRAIECGQLKIDVAFIAASAADDYGNLNGVGGPSACGSLGYAFADAEYADCVVAVTDNLVEYPLAPVSIPQSRVDYVVKVDCIGDPKGIVSSTTNITRDPIGLRIAQTAAKVIEAAGLVKDGLSFQTGVGGASLAVAYYLGKMMEEKGVKAGFALGGITGTMVDLLNRGLVKRIIDVQGFDLEAVRSLASNPNHLEISGSFYANPFNAGCAVNRLDTVVLGATEIDTQFNVNVVTGSDGVIMGGSGGHSDAAAGAKVTIIVANLLRGRLPTIVDNVLTVTTPGETVDVLVTERGVAVNPRRQDLVAALAEAGLPIMDIRELKAEAEKIAGVPRPIQMEGRIVALVEYRDGSIIDVVRQINK